MYKILLDCLPALPRLACLNHSMWLVVDVRMIAVAEIFSTRLSLTNLYTQFARYHLGGTAISTLATALAPTASA